VALEKLRKGKELAEKMEMDLTMQRTDWKARAVGWAVSQVLTSSKP
jgi:hypothetical protein